MKPAPKRHLFFQKLAVYTRGEILQVSYQHLKKLHRVNPIFS